MHPILFSFGPVHLYSYGVLVAIGVLGAVSLIRANAPRVSIEPLTVVDLATTTVISGFAGARILYVLQQWEYFRGSLIDMVKIWEGGIVLYGGLIGGLIGFSIFIWLKRLPFLSLLDIFVPGLALAQGFGRIGCFLNGCCYGKPSSVFWAVSFPFLDHKVHPTQLYEALFCFALSFALLALLRLKFRSGTVAFVYFIAYPVGRFFLEFLRGDNPKVLLNLTLSQCLSISFTVLAVGISAILRISSYDHKRNRSSA